jgi:hypothetical protein
MGTPRPPDAAPRTQGSWRERVEERIPWMHAPPRRLSRRSRPDGGIAGIAYGAAGWIGWPRDDH